jgi:hypothetical protein
MELSPSSEVVSRSVIQKFYNILRNPKVCNSHPPVFISSQINFVHIFKSNLNIILPTKYTSSWWTLSFWFYRRNPVCTPLVPVLATCLIILNPPFAMSAESWNSYWGKKPVTRLRQDKHISLATVTHVTLEVQSEAMFSVGSAQGLYN